MTYYIAAEPNAGRGTAAALFLRLHKLIIMFFQKSVEKVIKLWYYSSRLCGYNSAITSTERIVNMSKFADTFLRALLTGILIAVGGIVYLSCDSKYIGSALFGTGLFTVLTFGLALFTGKVGYAVEQKPGYLLYLCEVWLGNLVGAVITGLLIQLTRAGAGISEKAAALCEVKLNDNLLSIFVLSFFCGMLMFIAADGYNNLSNPAAQMLAVFLPVMVFILSGFEHCVANMFYFTAGNAWSPAAALYMLVMTLGNAAGGMLIPLARKGFEKPAEKR